MAADGKVEKAYLRLKPPTGAGSLGEVRFQFNPKEYNLKKAANWDSKTTRAATSTSMPEYKGPEPQSMTVEIFLDAGESPSGAITGDIETLFGCCTPTKESIGQNTPSPPFVEFGWGQIKPFIAYVKSVSAKYTHFKPDGTPTRALCSVELQELPEDPDRQNPTSGGLAMHRVHTVVGGDSLPSIAYREYADARLWRALAEVNGIDDPFRLPVGTRLMVPPADEAMSYA
jgi:hypothetical protein